MAIDHEDKDGIQQVLMYDAGIGTGNAIDKQLGGALGEGIDINILELYTFLALNYQVRDPCMTSPASICVAWSILRALTGNVLVCRVACLPCIWCERIAWRRGILVWVFSWSIHCSLAGWSDSRVWFTASEQTRERQRSV
jgi:hypothetical protein